MQKKADFISEEYTALAKVINSSIVEMLYVHDSISNEEWLIITYESGYKKKICITCDSLRAIVFDSITKL